MPRNILLLPDFVRMVRLYIRLLRKLFSSEILRLQTCSWAYVMLQSGHICINRTKREGSIDSSYFRSIENFKRARDNEQISLHKNNIAYCEKILVHHVGLRISVRYGKFRSSTSHLISRTFVVDSSLPRFKVNYAFRWTSPFTIKHTKVRHLP